MTETKNQKSPMHNIRNGLQHAPTMYITFRLIFIHEQ